MLKKHWFSCIFELKIAGGVGLVDPGGIGLDPFIVPGLKEAE